VEDPFSQIRSHILGQEFPNLHVLYSIYNTTELYDSTTALITVLVACNFVFSHNSKYKLDSMFHNEKPYA